MATEKEKNDDDDERKRGKTMRRFFRSFGQRTKKKNELLFAKNSLFFFEEGESLDFLFPARELQQTKCASSPRLRRVVPESLSLHAGGTAARRRRGERGRGLLQQAAPASSIAPLPLPPLPLANAPPPPPPELVLFVVPLLLFWSLRRAPGCRHPRLISSVPGSSHQRQARGFSEGGASQDR